MSWVVSSELPNPITYRKGEDGMGYKSYSQKKRESYDYRTNYIKHNCGIFGGVYICSQCYKHLSRKEMEVDHMFPVSKWYAPNRVINCVSICSTCNKSKSDKVTLKMSVKAILAKLFEEFYILIQKGILLILRLIFILLLSLVRICLTPLKTNRSILQKLVIVITYCYIIGLVVL